MIIPKRQRLRKGENRPILWSVLKDDLLAHRELYHSYFYKQGLFSGPSLYFHHRALNSEGAEKIEMTYAVLTSWGMHRMGGGAQMSDYEKFSKSINSQIPKIMRFKDLRIESVTNQHFKELNEIFKSIEPMRSKTKIVAHSKVMAHYLPKLIGPIDREYTFQFLNGRPKNTTFPINWAEEELFKEIHLKLFKPVALDTAFAEYAEKCLKNNKYKWDTSIPKIIDNLIIGKIKYLKLNDPAYS